MTLRNGPAILAELNVVTPLMDIWRIGPADRRATSELENPGDVAGNRGRRTCRARVQTDSAAGCCEVRVRSDASRHGDIV